MRKHEFENSALFREATTTFPLMAQLSNHLRELGTFNGARIGWNCHLTGLTALAVAALVENGCQLFMSECNPETTDPQSVDYMRYLGVSIFFGLDRFDCLLEQRPSVISDTGFDLLTHLLSSGGCEAGTVIGANEITTSGITRLRNHEGLPIPVINVNDSSIKNNIENFHGVGQGVVEALTILFGEERAKREATVVGYGQVGRGVAYYLRGQHMHVRIIESDPVRSLMAHYDGFDLSTFEKALPVTDFLVTCTGVKDLIPERLWVSAKDGLCIINAGHWSDEVSADRLRELARSVTVPRQHLEQLEIVAADGAVKTLYLACGGNPANVVLLTGSIEPTLLHLSTEILCMEFLLRQAERLPRGELPVPPAIEKTVAALALRSLEQAPERSPA